MPTLASASGEPAAMAPTSSSMSSSPPKMPAVTASLSTSPTRYGLFGRGQPKSPVREREEPGDEMSVELYTMIGDNAPMLMLNRKVAKEHELPPAARTKWQWREFANPARKDQLRLSHWERVPPADLADPAEAEANPYPFARFNVSTNVYSYSDDEYTKYLRDETGNWSRQETDYLFKLCHEYDLRWFVMHDRYDYASELAETGDTASGPVGQSQDASQDQQLQNGTDDVDINGGSASAPEVGATTVTEASAADAMAVDEEKAPVAGPAPPTDTQTTSSLETEAVGSGAPAVNQAALQPKDASPKPRSIEDMKERYYSVCRRLIRARPASDPSDENAELVKTALLQSYLFEKDREVARKTHIRDVLLKLTPEQLAEEEFLYTESRRLEQTYNKTAREREELWRLLGGVGPQSTSHLALTGSFLTPAAHANAANAAGLAGMNVANGQKKKRRGELDMLEDPQGGQKVAGVTSAPEFTPEQEAQFGISRQDASNARGSGAYLRSSRPPILKTKDGVKLVDALANLGISIRLAMPTRLNAERLESLAATMNALADARKQIDRLEGEVKILQTRRGAAMRIHEEERARAAALEKERASAGAETPAATPQTEAGSSMQVDG